MKKRKLLYLFPLAALVLSGCSFQDLMFWKKKNNEPEQQEEQKEQGGEQQGGEQGGEQGGGGEQQQKQDFVGLSLPNATVTYDGQPHSLEVVGDLPAGATVDYGAAGNSFTEVGPHEVTATVSCEGYNDLVLHGTLTIVASDFAGLSFTDASVEYDGQPHSISVSGELPQGAEVSYAPGNSFTAVGEYEITATVSCAGYNDLVLQATLTITKGNMVGVTFEDQEVAFDGNAHEIAPVIPAQYAGATVEYDENGNSFVGSGIHVVNATVSCEGYNDLQLSAKLTIGAGPVASQELNIVDFEDMSDNDLVDEFTLEYYNDGWVTPQAAKLGIEKNQVFAGGTNTMKMTLTHQGSAFKATKELGNSKTYNKYKGFSIDTMMDSRVDGGTMKAQVQFWFKDLPLPDAYAGYRNTYATYTLDNDAASVWTHWEIPFDDDSLSIASNATITQAFLAAGYTVEEFSPYIDKVAIIITPNYKDGGNCYAYIDNVCLTLSDDKVEERHIYGGKYAHIEGEDVYALELADNLETGAFSLNGNVVSALTISKTGTALVAKDAEHDGAGLTVTSNINKDGSLTVASVEGQAAAMYSGLVDMMFAKHANVNLDFTGVTTGAPLNDSHWYQEYWNETWLTTSGKMNVRGTSEDPHCNMTTGYYMDYRYTYTYPEHFGLADKFSIDISNDFNQGSYDLKLKIRLIKANGGEVYMAGSASEYQVVPANTAKWLHIEQTFDEINVKAVVVTVKSTTGANQYMYFDNLKVSHSTPEVTPPPQPTYTVEDGEYYIWNGASDAYRLTIADSQTTGSFTKCGSEDQYAVTVAVDGNNVTIKDATAAGAGLTVNAVLTDNNLMTVESVTGAMASALSASLVGKTVKHSASANLNFSDGTVDASYTNALWKESDYKNNGWTDYATPTNMRSKQDKNGNKVVNFHCGTGAKNFRYTPELPLGPVNHVEVDLGNYWSSSAGTLRYKISLLGSDGSTVQRYVAGDGSNWATLEKDTSQGNLCTKVEFDFDLAFAYALRITTSMASGEAYLYMDNLKVTYKAPEPTPAFVPTGDLLGGARIKCVTAAGSDTGYVTELNVGGAGNADFSGTGVYLRMKNNTGIDTPITMKFNSTNGTLIGPKAGVDHTYYDANGVETTGIAARGWGNYLMLPANFDGFIYMDYATQMSKIQGDADFDPAHLWRVYIEYSGSYDSYADFEIGDIFTDTQRVLDGSELDATTFASTWINQTGAVQSVTQLDGGVVPQPAFTLADGEYYVWNGNTDAFRMEISNNQTAATVTKCGGSSYAMTVEVNGETVTLKDAGYAGAGLTITATLTADNAMTITGVSGQMASTMSGSLLNKSVKHSASINLDFADGTKDATYTESHWTEQHYGNSGWTDYATPTQMRSKVDKNNNKIVNFAASTTAYNFLYTPDLPTGPINHLEVDLGNYYQNNTIQYKIAILGSDGNVAKYVAGDANNFASIAYDNSEGNLCKTQSFDFDLVVGYKVRITVKTASGTGYLYMDNLVVNYKAA